MTGENGVPETPEWELPKRPVPATCEAAEDESHIVRGTE